MTRPRLTFRALALLIVFACALTFFLAGLLLEPRSYSLTALGAFGLGATLWAVSP